MDTAEMEKAAGRMGAADKRVVYDHAAIERLLDRYGYGFNPQCNPGAACRGPASALMPHRTDTLSLHVLGVCRSNELLCPARALRGSGGLAAAGGH